MDCSVDSKVASRDNCKCDKVSLRLVYIYIIILFVLQIVAFYSLYAYYLNVDRKYEIWNTQLENRLSVCEKGKIRGKRDINIQDNVIPKLVDDLKSEGIQNDTFKNESISSNLNSSDENLVWLNKYSRVPLKMMQEFCKATKENCPTQKGDPGPKGDTGEKGEKGDVGKTGVEGRMGMVGSPGMKGDIGEKGEKGMSGLDGRAGIPGEPGLDGIPGRHGKDGIPGKNGESGKDGIPGTQGAKGEKGDRGFSGPIGPTGLPGKQGKTGNPGMDGVPGIPGIKAYSYSNNGTKGLLIPPSITGSEAKYHLKNITVKEYEKIKLTCSSTGEPKPVNIWRGVEDGKLVPVKQGQWGIVNKEADTLEFRNISRLHMGEYMCIANNAIPPSSNVTYYLNVFFPPYIEIENVILNVTLGGIARLECRIQAYPHGVYYWEDRYGAIYEETQGNFHVDYNHIGLYETILQLNITNVRKENLGIYYCVGKNEEGITQGHINVTDEPGTKLQVMDVCHKHRVTFGNPGPPAEGELCPSCTQCKICGFGYRDLEIRVFENNTFGPLRKNQSCEMETIGKPVFHNSLPNFYGSWMRESYLEHSDYYWVTLQNCTNCLYEYANKIRFTNKFVTKIHQLKEPFMDNDNVIYNGSFYYATNKNNYIKIMKYDLDKEIIVENVSLNYCDTSSSNYLYKTEHNHVDVMSDDNGLWAVCAMRESNNTLVTKFNTSHFGIEKAWNISVKHQDAGDMFIICGILYAVNSVKDYDTSISLALDLYSEKLLDDVSIKFTNPFMNTSMISYNQLFKELYTWDDGNMLTYPIKCRAYDSETPANETLINKNQNISHEDATKKQ